VNGATLTEDRFGNADAAYGFDEGNSISTSYSPSDVVATTYSAWFKTAFGGCIIGSNAGNSVPNLALAIHTNSTSVGNQGTALWVVDHDNPGSSVGWMSQQPANPLYNDDQWHHVVGVYNCPTGTTIQPSSLSLFVDGLPINTIEQNINPSNSPINILSNLVFGMNQRWVNQGFNGRFYGSLDDIGIWNRALTTEEVQELYTLDACSFTVYDTSYVTVYDTLTTFETVYDTLYTYETIYDTVTTYLTVTDTLLIDITFTGFEGQPSWLNTVTVFPNPASDHITIDYGNFALMAGYNTIITDAAGATVYSSAVNSQQAYIDINAWGAAGVYYMTIYDASGAAVAVRHIVLE
jgi:hypothetical protein